MAEMFEPISLGFACDVKYQVCRNVYGRLYPEGTEADFRNKLFRTNGAVSPFTRHIFDWMIVPRAAVWAYLENDFQGVFEREDLVIDEAGVVKHRQLLTLHPHDFHAPPGERLTDAMVDAQYADFRAKYEYLAERFRRHLQTPGPYLYVYKEVPKMADAQRLAAMLQARSTQHRFQMLFVDNEGAVNQVLNDPRFHKAWLPVAEVDKEPLRQWEGPDAAWDKVLDAFNLGLHVDGGAPVADETLAAAAPQAPALDLKARPPKTGWRTLTRTDSPEDFFRDYDHVDAQHGRERYFNEDGRHGFDRPEPDDHIFCHFIPADLAPQGGWARLTLRWPPAGARAGVILQEQGCRHGVAASDVSRTAAGGTEQTVLFRVPAGGDQLRLVMLPKGPGRSDLPQAITLEAHEPAHEAPGLLQRLKGLFAKA